MDFCRGMCFVAELDLLITLSCVFMQTGLDSGQIKYSGVMVLTQYCEIFAAGHVPGSVCTPHIYNYQYSHCTSCMLSHPASKDLNYIWNDCS